MTRTVEADGEREIAIFSDSRPRRARPRATSLDVKLLEGKVERGAHPTDRRSRVVCSTAKGRKEIEKVFAAHTDAMSDAARGSSGAEKATLVKLSKKLGTTADAS